MDIAVLGTGMVGRSLAVKLAETGHTVVMGTRSVDTTLAVTEVDAMGNLPFTQWCENRQDIALKSFAAAAAAADILFLATSGAASQAVLDSIGAELLDGKVIVDVSNYLEFTGPDPLPALKLVNITSLGEELQKAFPKARIVKTLNHVEHSLMVNPGMIEGNHNVFMSGDSEAAKTQVKQLLNSFGWKQEQIIDLGDIVYARAMEMHLILWCRMYQMLGTGNFNFELKQPH
ncbi:NADPH-dependent F420 reductase [Endozoicomonadaceae bacterium StTr2]